MIRTRFAPSPTGDLHLGGAWVALASFVVARRGGGKVLLRVEDLDGPRVVPGSAEAVQRDLAWLGLTWDEGPVFQSARFERYADALARLGRAGATYLCDCSRAEIARVASAPHPGEDVIYPGTCRAKDPGRPMRRPPAVRLRVPDGPAAHVAFVDGAHGACTEDVAREVGDFVLRRGDGTYAYQLAVVVDDLEMAVTDVLRGSDLLASTARQILLARLLGCAPPAYVHVPMVVAEDGTRLAKRTRGARVADLREAGVDPRAVVGRLAHALGLAPDAASRTPDEVVAVASAAPRWPVAPFHVPGAY